MYNAPNKHAVTKASESILNLIDFVISINKMK